MKAYRSKLDENGRIVLPESCRKELHLLPGDELVLHVENDQLHISSLKQSISKAQELVMKYSKKKSLVRGLKKLRKEDINNK